VASMDRSSFKSESDGLSVIYILGVTYLIIDIILVSDFRKKGVFSLKIAMSQKVQEIPVPVSVLKLRLACCICIDSSS
jgi:hypothetical protein